MRIAALLILIGLVSALLVPVAGVLRVVCIACTSVIFVLSLVTVIGVVLTGAIL